MELGTRVKYIGNDTRLRGKTGVFKGPHRDGCGYGYVVEFDGQPWALLPGCFTAMPPILNNVPALPTDSAERKRWPLYSGLLAYFPAALAHVSHHSYLGNEKHNPGQPLNHARSKSGDHADCIVRHLVDAAEHIPGSAARLDELSALAWRALALLQEECELGGHKVAPAATFNKDA